MRVRGGLSQLKLGTSVGNWEQGNESSWTAAEEKLRLKELWKQKKHMKYSYHLQ